MRSSGSDGSPPKRLHRLTGALSSTHQSPQLDPLEESTSTPQARSPIDTDPPLNSLKYRTGLPTIIEPDGISSSVAAGGEPVIGRDYVRMLAPSEMVARLVAFHHSVDAYDEHGWTCLHWAALLGQVEHVAALLDSEAEPLLPTVKTLALPWCEWASGTTAEQLARFPRGERGVNEDASQQPLQGHIACRSILRAAARGAFAVRLQAKRRGDVASASGNPTEAAAAYSEALGAVLQVGDSAVLQIEGPLASAEAAIDAAAAAGRAAAAAAHQAILAREAAEAQDMTRRQAAEAKQRGLQQEGLASLREAEANLAAGRAKEAIGSVSEAMRITCAVGNVQYGAHLVSVLKQAGAMQALAATAKEKAAGEEATRIKVRAMEQRIRETASEAAMELAKQQAEWTRERSVREQETAQLRLSSTRNVSEVNSLSDQLKATRQILEQRSSQHNLAKAGLREAEAECLRLNKQLASARESAEARKTEMSNAVRKVETRLAKQRASLQESASHTAMQLAEASQRQAAAEAALKELRKQISVERAAEALKRKVRHEESTESERKLATEVGKLRIELQQLQQDTAGTAQQKHQLQIDLHDARVKISSLAEQVEGQQARDRDEARQATTAMRTDAAIGASLKATAKALERLKIGLCTAKDGEQQALAQLREAEKRYALAGAEAEARLALVENAEAGAASLRAKLASAQRALRTAEERAEAAELLATKTADEAAANTASKDEEIYLLQKRAELSDGAKEQASASMAALKQALEAERMEKVAAQGALQAAKEAADNQTEALRQELKELRDVLALQEGAATGAGEAAALAEAEAAQLRESNASLQRELKESKEVLSDLRSRFTLAERSWDAEKSRRVEAETEEAELTARVSEAKLNAQRQQEEYQDQVRAWGVERRKLEAMVASEIRQKESAHTEVSNLQERLTNLEKAHIQERLERRAAARAVENGAEDARREHMTELATLRLKAEENALELQSANLSVKRLQELEQELRYKIEVKDGSIRQIESEMVSKESALQQSRRAAQVNAADSRLSAAKLQQELAEMAVEKASLQRQLAEAEAVRAHDDFDGVIKEARETVENQPGVRLAAPYLVLGEEVVTPQARSH